MVLSGNVTSTEEVLISQRTMMIFTWIVYSVICQLLNVFGIVTNILNIDCFLKQGLDDSINNSLLGLAVSDLGSLITMAWTSIGVSPAVVSAHLPFDSLDVTYLVSAIPHFTFIRISSCITAMITLERCLCITAPLKVKSMITPMRTRLIILCIFIINFCGSAPVYCVSSLTTIFSPSRNRTIVGLVFREDREIVEKITFTINNVSIPFCAFVIIIVCTITLSLQLKKQTKWRVRSVASQSDTVSNRNTTVAKMVVMIGAMFIVCFSPLTIIIIVAAFMPAISIRGKYMHVTLFVGGFCYVMENINSSMNIFIYYRMSSKFRLSFCKCSLLLTTKRS